MKYLLAAIDIDGTLSNSNKELSGYTVSTIIKAQKRGMRIVIASGRPTRGLAYYADLLQIYDYGGFVMAYNGGQITDWSTNKCILIMHYRKNQSIRLYNWHVIQILL